MDKKRIIWRLALVILLGPMLLIGIYNLTFNRGDIESKSDFTRGNENFSNELERIEFNQNLVSGTVSTPTLSMAVRNLPALDLSHQPELVREVNPRISHFIPGAQENKAPFFQDLNDTQADQNRPKIAVNPQAAETNTFIQPIMNIEGIGFTAVHPSDSTGAIGQDHYIQMVNSSTGSRFAIYNRNGDLVQGPNLLQSLGSGNCANGAGDPIVLYDQLANRWFMSEFNTVSAQHPVCLYISQTADPLGSWYVYEFNMPNFPDYPKYGLWGNAYLGTANEATGQSVPAVYAFEREKMLTGEPANFIRLEATRLLGFGFQALTPADLDGDFLPPDPSTALYMRHRDDEAHNINNNNSGTDFLEIWSLSINFESPNSSSLQKIADIPVPEFDSAMCGLSNFSCVPQPGTSTKLDPIREVIMPRLQYMNHQTHESLVGNMVTDLNGNHQHGIFWFELRRVNQGAWALYQSGTFGDTADHRWMGSIGMDVNQNIALVYNVSGDNTFPSLRYTGRLATDPLGTLPNQETVIGAGAVANPSIRYGDYSSLTLDPTDGCTFWATGQYNPASAWSTRIATFKFPSCQDSLKFFLSPTGNPLEYLEGEPIGIPALISADDGFTETVTISAILNGNSASLPVTPNQVNPSSTPSTVTAQAQPLTSGTYSATLTATSQSQTLFTTIDFTVVPTLSVTTVPLEPQNGQTLVERAPILSWATVDGATSYRVQLSTSPTFDTLVYEADAALTASYPLSDELDFDQVYYWRVRPENNFSQGEWATAQFRTKPAAGLCQAADAPVMILTHEFESGLGSWTTEENKGGWVISSTRPFTGSFSAMAGAPASTSSQKLISPQLTLAPTADSRWLSFMLWRDLEGTSSTCNDGLILEIGQNGVWEPIEAGSIISNNYDFPLDDFGNVLEGNSAWCGTQDWTKTLIDLSSYSKNIQIRWHLATDQSVGREGAYIDSVEIYECNPQSLTYYMPVIGKDGAHR